MNWNCRGTQPPSMAKNSGFTQASEKAGRKSKQRKRCQCFRMNQLGSLASQVATHFSHLFQYFDYVSQSIHYIQITSLLDPEKCIFCKISRQCYKQQMMLAIYQQFIHGYETNTNSQLGSQVYICMVASQLLTQQYHPASIGRQLQEVQEVGKYRPG